MHILYELDGVQVDESWAQARANGSGRHGDQVDAAARAEAIDVRLNLDTCPASARLRALIDVVEPLVVPADVAPARNAGGSERSRYLPDPELTALSSRIATWLGSSCSCWASMLIQSHDDDTPGFAVVKSTNVCSAGVGDDCSRKNSIMRGQSQHSLPHQ